MTKGETPLTLALSSHRGAREKCRRHRCRIRRLGKAPSFGLMLTLSQMWRGLKFTLLGQASSGTRTLITAALDFDLGRQRSIDGQRHASTASRSPLGTDVLQ